VPIRHSKRKRKSRRIGKAIHRGQKQWWGRGLPTIRNWLGGRVIYTEGRPEPIYGPATPAEINERAQKLKERAGRLAPVLAEADKVIRELEKQLPIAAPIWEEEWKDVRRTSNQVLEDDEAEAVLSVFTGDEVQLRDSLGPRSIRAFLFRYQFARLLLTRLKLEWDSKDLARELAAQVLTDQTGRTDKIPLPIYANWSAAERLRRIVEQVC
jgi:hypothetical protein